MKTIQQKLAEIIVNESSSLAEQIISRRFEKYPVKEKQLFDYQSSKDYITKFIQLCGSSLLRKAERGGHHYGSVCTSIWSVT